ncbi:Chaperone protein ClpB [Mesoplasma sp. JKS002658]|uniref:ATP-dependent Clp protease ATP-binding subunit n=1 Tax=Mesoplasma whartonense TaxID=2878854 RepID=UPI002022AE9F|nr:MULTISPECIES: AAA family ATPase [unclassified Mesoplasma]MCL8211117.1 Chaperone protein ClpB [Mesoplasma sp. JKS002664]MCL8211778.1 Chaperone protein ClpB [Mesoplasma sp. JKS002662]MCL8212638.1 Chaperone protein ClpB [Mesoplasma sp. JKS002661]MCL8213240.1 Chaperone protein ClpB [Mesoplasma sp. JKS002660]MCL8214117.1 Chaperone protein ClpB [Mesoplasma sp. JKS002658]
MDLQQKPNPQNDPNILEKYTTDLTLDAKEGRLDPVIGREDEILRVVRILSRKTKNNPVLIGEPGVGKTAVVEGLAQRIVNGDVPSNLKDKKILVLDMGLVMAGASYLGEYEARVKGIVNAVQKADGKIILFVDEVHLIVGAGKTGNGGGMDVSNLLKPALARGQLKMIGATTLDEYREYIEQDSALERRFQQVMVEEPTVDQTISILRGLKERFESFHGVVIHDNALVAAAKLSDQYITDRFLPDKAIDLIDEASATIRTELASVPTQLDHVNRKVVQLEIERAALAKETDDKSQKRLSEVDEELTKTKKIQSEFNQKWEKDKQDIKKVSGLRTKLDGLKQELQQAQFDGNYQRAGELQYSLIPNLEKELKTAQDAVNSNGMLNEEVTETEVAAIVSKWTGIPVNKLVESERKRLLELPLDLKKNVKGQDEAIEVVSDAIIRSRAGIKNPDKPIGSFLFLGPTGVGKTEVARTLADVLFSSVKKMVRIDMSEYMDRESVNKLIGAPPGYIGYGQGGVLTEAVRRNPYSIVLFDEIEKAHPDVFNVFLQILDEGRITDSSGRVVDFKNTIIIMTSNIGSELILNNEDEEVNLKLLMMELQKSFRPEFLNRIDNIVPFNALSIKVIEEIIIKDLDELRERLHKNGDYLIEFDPKVITKIKAEGYEREFGARPITRYIEKNIETMLSKEVINDQIKRNEKYLVTVSPGDEFKVEKI